jgi:hypothetical protein
MHISAHRIACCCPSLRKLPLASSRSPFLEVHNPIHALCSLAKDVRVNPFIEKQAGKNRTPSPAVVPWSAPALRLASGFAQIDRDDSGDQFRRLFALLLAFVLLAQFAVAALRDYVICVTKSIHRTCAQ